MTTTEDKHCVALEDLQPSQLIGYISFHHYPFTHIYSIEGYTTFVPEPLLKVKQLWAKVVQLIVLIYEART
jgi:hypothetical protein